MNNDDVIHLQIGNDLQVERKKLFGMIELIRAREEINEGELIVWLAHLDSQLTAIWSVRNSGQEEFESFGDEQSNL